MTIPIGKITILVGAGIVGSVLAKEGRLPYVSDFVSGAFKIAFKRIRRDDSRTSTSKPHNESLMDQVKSLQQELRMLSSNHPITIVTTGRTGARRFGVIIVVVVVGYGYVWWKGWKLPDMMFASKRSLSDACTAIAKKLENVYSSIAATKRNLSSRIDRVDKSLDDSMEITADTQERVSELLGRSDTFGRDIKSVHHAVQTLENKLWSFEEKQDLTNEGVRRLCNYALNLENATIERNQAISSSSSKPALELPSTTPSARAISSSSSQPALELPSTTTPSARIRSLPLGFSPEALSPSDSNASNQVQRSLLNAVSDPGLMREGITDASVSSGSRDISDETGSTPDFNRSEARSSAISGFGFLNNNASFLTRTRSAMNAVLRQARSSVQS